MIKIKNGLLKPDKEAGDYISSVFSLFSSDTPVLFLSSGGSALSILEYVDISSLPKNLTVGVLDERVTQNSEESNFSKLVGTRFFKDALKKGIKSIDTRTKKNETREQLSERFENSIREWIRNYPNGEVVVTMGMGEDGHTAGIFPTKTKKDFNILFPENRLVVSLDVGDKSEFSKRATVTPLFLKTIPTYTIAYVVGDKKSKALKIALNENIEHKSPASIINIMLDVIIFTDINIS